MSVAELTRSCLGCGVAFEPSRRDRRYCSEACRNRARVRRHRHPEPEEVCVCPDCGALVDRLDPFTGFCQPCTRERQAAAA